MTVYVDLPAMRPGRLAESLAATDLAADVRALHTALRGARVERLADGIRLVLARDIVAVARLAELIRAEADTFPFWSFRVLAEPPVCWLEVRGDGRAADLARAVFGALP